MPRHHGFTCPNCSGHYFGTSQFPNGIMIGHCHSHQHTNNGCEFIWDRNDPVKEAECMYEQTPEEWAQSFKEWEKLTTAAPTPEASE